MTLKKILGDINYFLLFLRSCHSRHPDGPTERVSNDTT